MKKLSHFSCLGLTLVCAPAKIRTWTALGNDPSGSGLAPAPSYQLRHEGISQSQLLPLTMRRTRDRIRTCMTVRPGESNSPAYTDSATRAQGPVIQPLALTYLLHRFHGVIRHGIPALFLRPDLPAHFQAHQSRSAGAVHRLEVGAFDAVHSLPEYIDATQSRPFFHDILNHRNYRAFWPQRFSAWLLRRRRWLGYGWCFLACGSNNARDRIQPAFPISCLLARLNLHNDLGNGWSGHVRDRNDSRWALQYLSPIHGPCQ